MNAMPFARCLPMSQTARAGCGRLDAHEHHVKAKKSGNQNQKGHGRVVRSVLTVSADAASFANAPASNATLERPGS